MNLQLHVFLILFLVLYLQICYRHWYWLFAYRGSPRFMVPFHLKNAPFYGSVCAP